MSFDIFNNHGKKLSEALEVLNEAAKEKKEEVQKLITDRYSDIQDVLYDVVVKGRKDLKRMKRLAEDAIEDGRQRIEESVGSFNKAVKKNPWTFIGAAALWAFLIGLLCGGTKGKEYKE